MEKIFPSRQISLNLQIFCGFLYVIGHLRMYWMLAENLQWYNFLYSLVEFILHIVFNVLFIHLYGVKGAVFGILTAQWTTFFLTTIFIKEIRPFLFFNFERSIQYFHSKIYKEELL